MEIGQQRIGDLVVVTPTGHLDSKSSPELETLLVELLDQGRERYLIDFADVETISSAALRVLLMFSRRLNTTGGRLALCSLNSHVRQVFDISGFSGSFGISESRQLALEALAGLDTRAVGIARRAATAIGLRSSTKTRDRLGEPPGRAVATGAMAVALLKRPESAPVAGDDRSEPASPKAAATPQDPLLGVSGGASQSPEPEVSDAQGLWSRLRRGMDSRRQ